MRNFCKQRMSYYLQKAFSIIDQFEDMDRKKELCIFYYECALDQLKSENISFKYKLSLLTDLMKFAEKYSFLDIPMYQELEEKTFEAKMFRSLET